MWGICFVKLIDTSRDLSMPEFTYMKLIWQDPMVQSHVCHLSSLIMQNLCCNEPGDNWFRLFCGIYYCSTVYYMMLCTSMLLRLFCWPHGWFICGTLLQIIRITRTKTTVAQEACPGAYRLTWDLPYPDGSWFTVYSQLTLSLSYIHLTMTELLLLSVSVF